MVPSRKATCLASCDATSKFHVCGAESIHSRPRRNKLGLGPLVKIVRKENNIQICALDHGILERLESTDFLQFCMRP